MKVYTTNSTSMRRKRSSVLLQTTVIAKIQTMLAKVRGVCQSFDGMLLTIFLDLPSRPTKKHDEESVASSKRDDSPILKKASVSLQLRS